MSSADLSAGRRATRADTSLRGAGWRRMASTLARLLAVCAVLLALTTPVWAEVSRDQAAAAAQQQTGGRVLSVDKAEAGKRSVWRVKVVTPRGEVRVVFIDAGPGRGG